MKAIINLLSLFVFFAPLTVVAKEALKDQTFVVNSNDTVIAAISKQEMTRIAFESEIAFISSIAGELEYTTREQDLYLRPNVEKPINFFVKTADEHTYKFIVSSRDLPATQIFIKSNSKPSLENKLILYGEQITSEGLQKRISKLIDIALQPRKYAGFKFEKSNKFLRTLSDLSVQKIAEVSGMQLNAEVIVISNENDEMKTINPKEFMEEGTAIYIEKSTLQKNEKTKLIRIRG